MTVEQDKLAALRQRCLERNDEIDPGGRVYIHKETGDYFHSVTRILSATMAPENKKALEKWLERPDSIQTRDMAAARGTAAHNISRICSQNRPTPRPIHSKQTQCLARGRRWPLSSTRKDHKMGTRKSHSRCPKSTLERFRFCSRGLRGWILDHVTAIHSYRILRPFIPPGFAGACDALLDLDGKGPFICRLENHGKVHSCVY